jgi:putative nucleotidyltransferase with HDIG domain
MQPLPLKARVLVHATVWTGVAILAASAVGLRLADPFHLPAYLLLAIVASGLKLKLPGIDSSFSFISVFMMVAVLELTLPEAALSTCVGTLVQCYWHINRRPKPIQVMFSAASMMIAVSAAWVTYRFLSAGPLGSNLPVKLLVTGVTLFVMNTVPIAAIIAATEEKSTREVWKASYLWCLPYYLVGAAIAGILNLCYREIGWNTWLLVVPVVYSIHQSCRIYLNQAEAEKKFLREVSEVQLRTIETLALAIEAKDITTHDHLRRVRIYAVALGKKLGLSKDDLEALQAAAILHDVGKLAVPEYIISKPGKLAPEEFEKMKVHPVVGAEIVERVEFPYPVAPIVLAHHEKWDGSGYPFGLKGEEIPLPARILTTVDCFDALTSDRQYRRALPLEKAIEMLKADAGRAFDPKVVEVFTNCYAELEQAAHSQPSVEKKLSTGIKIERGKAPDAGFESSARPVAAYSDVPTKDIHSFVAVLQDEIRAVAEVSDILASRLTITEVLSILCLRLKQTIPYDGAVVYLRHGVHLRPEFACGEDSALFSSLRIPVGQGLSGWVAEYGKPMLNGNPAVETAHLDRREKTARLRSGLVVPLNHQESPVGVLALYRADPDAFSREELSILLAVSSRIATVIESVILRRDPGRAVSLAHLNSHSDNRALLTIPGLG